MAIYVVSALIFWAVCLGLTFFARRDHPFVDQPAFIWAGSVALFFGMAILVGGSAAAANATPAYGALYFLGGLVPGIALLMPFIWQSMAILAGEVQRELVGVESMKIERTYDAADRFMFDQKFDEAERAYLAGAESVPDDPEPLRRAGEAALAGNRVQDAVRHFRHALSRIKSEEDRASLGIRIAEIEERKLGDRTGARRTLEGLLPELGTGKWGEFVRERLEKLARPS